MEIAGILETGQVLLDRSEVREGRQMKSRASVSAFDAGSSVGGVTV